MTTKLKVYEEPIKTLYENEPINLYKLDKQVFNDICIKKDFENSDLKNNNRKPKLTIPAIPNPKQKKNNSEGKSEVIKSQINRKSRIVQINDKNNFDNTRKNTEGSCSINYTLPSSGGKTSYRRNTVIEGKCNY